MDLSKIAHRETLIKSVVSMAAITVITVTGLALGHDGVLLGTAIGYLAAMGGYVAGKHEGKQSKYAIVDEKNEKKSEP